MSIVEELEAGGEILSAAVRAVIERLERRIAELEAQLKQNSTNSSKPPSSDFPGVVREPKKPTGKKRGGQAGHPGHFRARIPEDRVNHTLPHRPEMCRGCGESLADAAEAGSARVHQVVELPAPSAIVTEHQLMCLRCSRCGTVTEGQLPAEVGGKHFGPRLVAMASELHARYRMSVRETADLLGRMLDVPGPSVGCVESMLRESSAALAPVYDEVREAVRRSAAVGVDETPWKLAGKKWWLWVATTAGETMFRLGSSRGSGELRAFLGEDYRGVVSSDRWCAYQIYARRQLCWAHLPRSFRRLGLLGGKAAGFATRGEAICRRMFRWWWQVVEGRLSRVELKPRMERVQKRLRRLLEAGEGWSQKKVAGFCRNVLKLWDSLWTYLDEPVEPTNNAAERAIRPAVLWRKGCFGNQSEAGLRFVERALTLNATARQRELDPIEFLARAIHAHRSGTDPPKLLPSG